MSRVQVVLLSDARDVRYHAYGKTLLIIPVLLMYAYFFLLRDHSIYRNQKGNQIIAEARDGLKMTIKDDLPEWKIQLHSFSAIFLLLLCLFQKETVRFMASNYRYWVKVHRWIGRIALFLVFSMNLGGFLMGDHSTLTHFDYFIYAFAAPFLIFGIALYLTASVKFLEYHRLFANMLVKGCIGTPIARLAGAFLQNQGWSVAEGYYQGIGFVTVVLGLWQVWELVEFVSSSENKTEKLE